MLPAMSGDPLVARPRKRVKRAREETPNELDAGNKLWLRETESTRSDVREA